MTLGRQSIYYVQADALLQKMVKNYDFLVVADSRENAERTAREKIGTKGEPRIKSNKHLTTNSHLLLETRLSILSGVCNQVLYSS